MDTSGITTSATIDEFHGSLDDAISRVGSGHERVLVTKNGEAVAVLIGPEDFDLLERLELQRDSAEYRAARAADDGGEQSASTRCAPAWRNHRRGTCRPPSKALLASVCARPDRRANYRPDCRPKRRIATSPARRLKRFRPSILPCRVCRTSR
jgi:prevent-host-death family protein